MYGVGHLGRVVEKARGFLKTVHILGKYSSYLASWFNIVSYVSM
jgi:hypothetical protein